jgi:hypothetical protein
MYEINSEEVVYAINSARRNPRNPFDTRSTPEVLAEKILTGAKNGDARALHILEVLKVQDALRDLIRELDRRAGG